MFYCTFYFTCDRSFKAEAFIACTTKSSEGTVERRVKIGAVNYTPTRHIVEWTGTETSE